MDFFRLAVGVGISCCLSISVFASQDSYWDFNAPEIKQVSVEQEVVTKAVDSPKMELHSLLMMPQMNLGDIVNMGKFIWGIIDSNRPVANIRSDVAHAMPRTIRSWSQLQDWQAPTMRTFNVIYKNKLGWKVIDFTYQLLYTYGGTVDGHGRFLTGITIVPSKLDITYGYQFNVKASVPAVYNMATKEEPVAGAQILVKWSVDTLFKHGEVTNAYVVDGNGNFGQL